MSSALKCSAAAAPRLVLPDYGPSHRVMEPSISSSSGSPPKPAIQQHPQQQQQRNYRTTGASVAAGGGHGRRAGADVSIAAAAVSKATVGRASPGAAFSSAVTKPTTKGSFGGARSASQNLPQHHIFQFGTVGLDTVATNVAVEGFPQLSAGGVGKAPVATPLRTVSPGGDNAPRADGGLKAPVPLDSTASGQPGGEGTSTIMPNIQPQVPPNRAAAAAEKQPWSQRPPLGSGERSKGTDPPAPSGGLADVNEYPPLSAVANRSSSRKGRGRGLAEQVETHPRPSDHPELQPSGAVDDLALEQPHGDGGDKMRYPNRNRQSGHHDRRKAGDGQSFELRNGVETDGWRDRSQNSQGRDAPWDQAKTIDALGRTLTRILRHQAAQLNLKMSTDGYVPVQDLLQLAIKTAANRPLLSHSIDDVQQVVQQDNKQRFGIKEENGHSFIRANQGHTMETVKSEHLLLPIVSADEIPVCVHGTFIKFLDPIFKEGLKRMQRNHIHFATGVVGSEGVISGMRRSSEVLIHLNVQKALEDGMKLYISENKVILTEGFDGVVPPEYFKEVLSIPDMMPIAPPQAAHA